MLFDDLRSLCRLIPLVPLVSPEDGGEEPLTDLPPQALPAAQSGPAVANQVGAVETEGQTAEGQPGQGEAADIRELRTSLSSET